MSLTFRTSAAIALGIVMLAVAASTGPGRRALTDLGVDVGGDAAPTSDWSWPFAKSHRLHQKVWGARSDDRERGFWASAGKTVTIDARVEHESGALSVILLRQALPVTIVWSARFEQSERTTATVQLPETGNYDLVVRMISFGGEYDVKWTIE